MQFFGAFEDLLAGLLVQQLSIAVLQRLKATVIGTFARSATSFNVGIPTLLFGIAPWVWLNLFLICRDLCPTFDYLTPYTTSI